MPATLAGRLVSSMRPTIVMARAVAEMYGSQMITEPSTLTAPYLVTWPSAAITT